MAYDEKDKCWHLMVTTYGGKVSMLQNLDAPTARQAYQRLRWRDHPVKFINTDGLSSWSSGLYSCSNDDVSRVDILGPEGEKLDPWRGVEPRIVDMAPERERQKTAEAEWARKRQEANERAQGLNVLKELTPHISDGFRCACCSKMMVGGSLRYVVPEGVRKDDDPEAIRDAVKRSNGAGRYWCKNCVPKEPKKAFKAAGVPEPPTERRKWWQW